MTRALLKGAQRCSIPSVRQTRTRWPACAPFDTIMEHVAVPEDVTFEAGAVGGVPGWWSKLKGAQPNAVILHIHGGWFNWGSAKAFRNLVGHLARHAGAIAFTPDYRLAPENPFPAGPEDVRACYAGLIELGYKKIAVTGDSAGGTLALGLLISLRVDATITIQR
jgi:epsilon-lactone hydrolase